MKKSIIIAFIVIIIFVCIGLIVVEFKSINDIDINDNTNISGDNNNEFLENNKNQEDNENKMDNTIQEDKIIIDVATTNYIKQLSNEDIEKIMGWNFSKNSMVSLDSEYLYENIEDFNDYGYFSNDGKNFINVDDNGIESISKHVKVSFVPELKDDIKICTGFGYENYIGFLVTTSGDLYIGELDIIEKTKDEPLLAVDFKKYNTDKKVIGIDKNVFKYEDGSFGFIDCTVDYNRLKQYSTLSFEEMYKIIDLNVDNLSDDIVYRILNGSYVIKTVKDLNGNESTLQNINISNVEYLICGSLSVYGFLQPHMGLRFQYIDSEGIEKYETACRDAWFLEETDAKSKINNNKNLIDISNSSFFEKVIYKFELDGNEIKNRVLYIYTQNGYIIEAEYDSSIEELQAQYDNLQEGKYVALSEMAAYGVNYYEYFKTNIIEDI